MTSQPRPDPAAVPPHGVLVYDGGCGFCTRTARFAAVRLRPAAGGYAVTAYQDADLPSLGLTARECEESVRWVAGDGSRYAAQDAIARALLASRAWARPAGALLLARGVNQVVGVVYRWVSRHRHRLPGGTPACSLPADERPG